MAQPSDQLTQPAEAEPSPAADFADQKARLAEALEQLRAAQSKLVQAQKLETIGQIAAGIAHEVNTPAQYVTDNVSFLQRAFDKLLKLVETQGHLVEAVRNGDVTPLMLEAADAVRREVKLDYLARQVPRAIEQSMQGLEQISSIVKAMKEFSRPSDAERQPSDLHDLIESVSVVVRSEWRHISELELSFDWSLPAVPLLRNEFAQLMLNLIVEAAQAISTALPQASTHKGKITIVTKLLAGQAQVRVSHDAGGIASKARSQVLSPAHSLVVEKHGGSIAIESTTGPGTAWLICLPLASS